MNVAFGSFLGIIIILAIGWWLGKIYPNVFSKAASAVGA